MYKDISIPETNELKELISELLEYCDAKNEDDELDETNFSDPVSEEEIKKWEKENGVSIPESYKQWLRFTGDCEIDGTTAEFYSPKKFSSKYVPDDLVIIGEQIGDGELVCFSKETGEIVTYFEGNVRKHYGTFDKTLKEVVRLMGKEEEESKEEELERLKGWKANLEKIIAGATDDEDLLECMEKIDEMIRALEE